MCACVLMCVCVAYVWLCVSQLKGIFIDRHRGPFASSLTRVLLLCVLSVCCFSPSASACSTASSPSTFAAASSSTAVRVARENPIIKTRRTTFVDAFITFSFLFAVQFSRTRYTPISLSPALISLSLSLFHSLSLLSSFIFSLALFLCLSFYCLSLFQFCVLFHFVVSTRAWRTIFESLSMQVEINNVRIFNEQRRV